jgi:Flp pilus assembly protein TadB
MIDNTTLLAMLAGGVVGGGLLLLIAAIIGWAPPQPGDARPGLAQRINTQALIRRLVIALVAALLALLITRWPVAAIAAALLGFFARSMFGGAAASRAEMAKLESLASWTESLRDTIAGAVGLEQAIPATYNAAGLQLKRPLGLLIDRLRTREPLPDALMKFADDLHDTTADLIVAALVLNARLRGPGLRDVLSSLSTAAREELDVRGRIEASRKSIRRSVQIILGLTMAIVFGLTLLNRRYVAPYSTPSGQLALAVVFGIFAAGFLWLRRLAEFEVPERFLTNTGRTGTPVAAAPAERAEVSA